MEFQTDSYFHWLALLLFPAVALGVLNDAIIPAAVTAGILASAAYVYFTYPF